MAGLGWTIPVVLVQLLLPVAAAMTGALYGWPVTSVLCVLAAAAGWAVLPQEALPVVLFWCIACGLTSCLPMKRRLLRPALRSGMCLAAWGIGLFILLRLTGGQIVSGLAQAACDYVDRSPDSTELLLRAYSAGYARLEGTAALAPAVRLMGTVVIPAETRIQMLYSLRVSLEEILPTLLCSAVVYHTALTVVLRQATMLFPFFISSGHVSAHSGMAQRQRVRKRQPGAGLIGLATSPSRMIRSG